MANAPRGRVTAKNDGKGNLTLQLPTVYASRYYGVKQKYISFGAKDTPENMRDAMTAALEMQKDIESDKFDPLETAKYKHLNKQLGNYNQIESISVISLFNDFVKNLIIEPTTRDTVYLTYFNHLKRMTDQYEYTLKQQSEIDIWIRNNTAESAVILLLALLYRMIEWCKRESKLPKDFPNKFKQYEQDFKKSLRGQRAKKKPPAAVAHLAVREGIQAHSEENRDKIIAAFHNRHRSKYYSSRLDHTAYLVEFLFLTGCRHGEAFALVWKDIEYGNNKKGLLEVKINVDESYNSKKRIIKNTKTRKHRKVPATNRVVEILELLKPENPDPNLLVFRNTNDKNFSTSLMTGLWIPTVHDPDNGQIDYSIIGKMIRDGELDYYMDFYSTRRTFASIQISKGVPPNVVAKWIGDNVETILKHYARPDDDAVPY
jgi:integrase